MISILILGNPVKYWVNQSSDLASSESICKMKALAFMKDAYISAMLEIYTNNFFITGIIKNFYIPIISGWETETVEMPIFPKNDSH